MQILEVKSHLRDESMSSVVGDDPAGSVSLPVWIRDDVDMNVAESSDRGPDGSGKVAI